MERLLYRALLGILEPRMEQIDYKHSQHLWVYSSQQHSWKEAWFRLVSNHLWQTPTISSNFYKYLWESPKFSENTSWHLQHGVQRMLTFAVAAILVSQIGAEQNTVCANHHRPIFGLSVCVWSAPQLCHKWLDSFFWIPKSSLLRNKESAALADAKTAGFIVL